MKVKCEYCDSFIDDTADFCPNCGAVNANVMRSSDGIPKTIEELLAFCRSKNMDLQRMRFFIGENYTQPRAYGIYKDGDNFIVYKNKSDGSRAVRYRGTDEAYAVNEIYQKLWSEVQTRRAKDISGPEPSSGQTTPPTNNGKGCLSFLLTKFGGILVIIFVLLIGSCMAGSRTGGSSFYPSHYSGYYSSGYDDYDYDYESSNSSNSSSWDSDWDSDDWDFDFGSWDSFDSDWGSDWFIR